jgi:prophage antirepressor-like protein
MGEGRGMGAKTDHHGRINKYCMGVTKRDTIDSMGREQQANFIPEGDVYRLITRKKNICPRMERQRTLCK